jgi:hypothetical protein
MAQFTSSDCWMLFSIGFDRKGANLMRILANGDRINHAIFMREELEEGLNKLVGNGFVRTEKGIYYATKKAKDFYRKNGKFWEGFIDEWIRIAEVFIKLPVSDDYHSVTISQEEYNKALNKYYNYFDTLEKSSFIQGIRKLFGLK